MSIKSYEVIAALRKYFSEHGFGEEIDIELKKKKGKITIGSKDKPLQTLEFIAKKSWFGSDWNINLEGDYLECRSLKVIESFDEQGPASIKCVPSTRLGLFGEKSSNLRQAYKAVPSFITLLFTDLGFGLKRGLEETSAYAKLFMNLEENVSAGIISQVTNGTLTFPGAWLGEQRGTAIVNERITSSTPASKIKKCYNQELSFLSHKNWAVREALEEHLKKSYFKSAKDFEEKYLAKVEQINIYLLKASLNQEEKARDLAKVIFGEKFNTILEKDAVLYQHLKNTFLIKNEIFDPAFKRFFKTISPLSKFKKPDRDPVEAKNLWSRQGGYSDLINNLTGVIKKGFYEETTDELRALKEIKKFLEPPRDSKKPRKEDPLALEQVVRNWQASLLTNQSQNLFLYSRSELEKKIGGAKSYFEEFAKTDTPTPEQINRFSDYLFSSSKSELEKRIKEAQELLKEIAKPGATAVQPETKEHLLNYINSRISAVRKSGVSEKKVYCTLAEAKKKFLDGPLLEHRNELTPAEMSEINKNCFKYMNRTKYGEMASTVFLGGLFGLSHYVNRLPGGQLFNALCWGLPIGSRALYESYCHFSGERVMEYYLLVKYRKALETGGVDPEAAFSEMRSVLSRVYLAGYMVGTAIGMPFLYSTTPERPWPAYIPAALSVPVSIASFAMWFYFGSKAKKENNI